MKRSNLKNKIYIAVILCAALLLAGCGSTAGAPPEESQPAPDRKVIIDTDAGADDISAIIMAARSGHLDILGVTTLVGNVDLEQSTKNVLAALEIAGSDAPVYGGSTKNYKGKTIDVESVFGEDGMGDADLIHPSRTAEKKDAIDFILDTVKENPDEVEIIALGPATNIAKAIKKDPKTMSKVKHIWSLGTAGQGVGNATPVAEFNVYADPPAYEKMLNSGIGMTVIGLDMCGDEAEWTDEQFEELTSSGEIGEFIAAAFTKIREFYTANDSPESVKNCDTVAMSCIIYPEVVTDTIQCYASCITDPGETFGEVIFYEEGFTYDMAENDYDYNVTLVTDLKRADIFRLFMDTI